MATGNPAPLTLSPKPSSPRKAPPLTPRLTVSASNRSTLPSSQVIEVNALSS